MEGVGGRTLKVGPPDTFSGGGEDRLGGLQKPPTPSDTYSKQIKET